MKIQENVRKYSKNNYHGNIKRLLYNCFYDIVKDFIVECIFLLSLEETKTFAIGINVLDLLSYVLSQVNGVFLRRCFNSLTNIFLSLSLFTSTEVEC